MHKSPAASTDLGFVDVIIAALIRASHRHNYEIPAPVETEIVDRWLQ